MIPTIEKRIDEYRRTTPGIFSWEVKEKLLADGLCSKETLPILTDISKMLRKAMHYDKDDMCGDINLETSGDALSFDNLAEERKLQTGKKTEREKSKEYKPMF